MILLFLILPLFAFAQECLPPDYPFSTGGKEVCRTPDGLTKWAYYPLWGDVDYTIPEVGDSPWVCQSLFFDMEPGVCVPMYRSTALYYNRIKGDVLKFIKIHGPVGVATGRRGLHIYLVLYIPAIDKEVVYLVPDREDCCSGGINRYLIEDGELVSRMKHYLGVE